MALDLPGILEDDWNTYEADRFRTGTKDDLLGAHNTRQGDAFALLADDQLRSAFSRLAPPPASAWADVPESEQQRAASAGESTYALPNFTPRYLLGSPSSGEQDGMGGAPPPAEPAPTGDPAAAFADYASSSMGALSGMGAPTDGTAALQTPYPPSPRIEPPIEEATIQPRDRSFSEKLVGLRDNAWNLIKQQATIRPTPAATSEPVMRRDDQTAAEYLTEPFRRVLEPIARRVRGTSEGIAGMGAGTRFEGAANVAGGVLGAAAVPGAIAREALTGEDSLGGRLPPNIREPLGEVVDVMTPFPGDRFGALNKARIAATGVGAVGGGIAGALIGDENAPGGTPGQVVKGAAIGAQLGAPGIDLATGAYRLGGRALRAGAEDAARAGIVTEDAARTFHGTASTFDVPDPGKFDEGGLYGPGYYTTSDPRVASSYAEARRQMPHEEREAYLEEAQQFRDMAAHPSTTPADRDWMLQQADDNEHAARAGVRPGAAPQVRAIEQPGGMRLLDVDAPLPPDELTAATRILDAIPLLDPMRPTNLRNRSAARVFAEPGGGQELYTALSRLGGTPAQANRALRELGYDGIKYAGGQRIPLQDAAGKPIEHDAYVIFSEALPKLRNTISGRAMGAFWSPGGAEGGGPRAIAGTQTALEGAAGTVSGAATAARADEEERARGRSGAERALVGVGAFATGFGGGVATVRLGRLLARAADSAPADMWKAASQSADELGETLYGIRAGARRAPRAGEQIGFGFDDASGATTQASLDLADQAAPTYLPNVTPDPTPRQITEAGAAIQRLEAARYELMRKGWSTGDLDEKIDGLRTTFREKFGFQAGRGAPTTAPAYDGMGEAPPGAMFAVSEETRRAGVRAPALSREDALAQRAGGVADVRAKLGNWSDDLLERNITREQAKQKGKNRYPSLYLEAYTQELAARRGQSSPMRAAAVEEVTNGATSPAVADSAPPPMRQAAEPPAPEAPPSSRTEAYSPKTIEATGVEDPSRRYTFRAKVMSMDDALTSNTDTLTVNPNYPGALQPRDRSRGTSAAQIEGIARGLNPDELLLDKGILDRGPMIVGPDNAVESGNGRMLGLRRARTDYPEQWAAYQARLREVAADYGIDPAALEGIKDPVLVRERTTRMTPAERVAFAEEGNRSAVAQMAPTEKARQDARSLPTSALEQLAIGEGATLDQALMSANNRAAVRAFLGVIPENERAGLMDKSGANLNREGLARLKAAIFAKTFPGDAGSRLLDAFFESTDEGSMRIQSGVTSSLPALAKAQALVETGAREAGLSIGDDLAAAVDMFMRVRARGQTIPVYLDQLGFLGRELTPTQEVVLEHLDRLASGRRGSAKKVRDFLQGYADAVVAAPTPGQGGFDLFGGSAGTVAQRTKGDVLRDLIAAQGGNLDDAEKLAQARAGASLNEPAPTAAPAAAGEELAGAGARPDLSGESSVASAAGAGEEAGGVVSAGAPAGTEVAAGDAITRYAPGEEWKAEALTPWDTADVVEARARVAAMPRTNEITTPERQALRSRIADELYGTGAARKERRADLVLGPPAAGKSSTMAEPLAAEHGSLIVDSDDAKRLLPEFANGVGANAVHEESTMIAQGGHGFSGSVLERALDAGDNIVLPLVGKTYESVKRSIEHLRAEGYDVHVTLVDLAAETAAKRAVARFESTGRFVDPAYVYNDVDGNPLRTYTRLKEEGLGASYRHVVNDTPVAEPARELEHIVSPDYRPGDFRPTEPAAAELEPATTGGRSGGRSGTEPVGTAAGGPPGEPPRGTDAALVPPEPARGPLDVLAEARGTPEQRAQLRPQEEGRAANVLLKKFPTDVRNHLQHAADVFDEFAGSRRGVVTDEQARAAAEGLGTDPAQWMKTKTGRAFTEHEVIALGLTLKKTGRELTDFRREVREARSASQLTPELEARLADKALEFAALSAVRSGATAEAGRALRAFREAFTDPILLAEKDRGKIVQKALDVLGGSKQLELWMAEFEKIEASDLPEAVKQASRIKMAAALYKPTLWDKLDTWRYSSMLSSYKTHLANTTSNFAQMWSRPTELAVAGYGREAAEHVNGMYLGIADGIAAFGHALDTGLPRGGNPITSRYRAFGEGAIGRTINAPLDLLMGADEFFKAVNSSGALRAEAYLISRRTGQAIDDVLKEMPTLHGDAVARAHRLGQEATFTDKPEAFGQWLSIGRTGRFGTTSGARVLGLATSFVMPFVRTPARIFYRGGQMAARGLGGGILSTGYQGVRGAMKGEGFLNREMRLEAGRTAIASLFSAGFASLAVNGYLTGSGPTNVDARRRLEEAGWQSHSLRIGDRWVDYTNFGPIGVQMAAIASGWEGIQANDRRTTAMTPAQRGDQLARDVTSRIGSILIDTSYVRGVADLFDSVQQGTLLSPSSPMLGGMVTQMVPFGSALAQAERLTDPQQRETASIGDRLLGRIPGASNLVPEQPDPYGGTRYAGSRDLLPRIVDAVLPWRSQQQRDDPIAGEVARLSSAGQNVSAKTVGAREPYAGAMQAPEQRRLLQGTLGEAARTYIADYLSRPEYQALDDAGKAATLNKALGTAYDLADRQLGDKVARDDQHRALMAWYSVPQYEGMSGLNVEQVRRRNYEVSQAKAKLAEFRKAYGVDQGEARLYREDRKAFTMASAPRLDRETLERRRSEVDRQFGGALSKAETSGLVGAGNTVLSSPAVTAGAR